MRATRTLTLASKIPAGIIVVLCSAIALSAGAHDTSEPYAEWFNAQKDVHGNSCCGFDHDCRYVEAIPTDDGWEVWADWPNFTYPKGGWRLIKIPFSADQHLKNPTGQAVLCTNGHDDLLCWRPASET